MSITDDERRLLIEHRMQKAYDVYDDALFTLNANRCSNAANRLYYALFHACGALLLSIGKEANRHSGMRSMISQFFIKEGKLDKEDGLLLHEIFIIRQQCDYDDYVEISKEQLEKHLLPIRNLIDKISRLLGLPVPENIED